MPKRNRRTKPVHQATSDLLSASSSHNAKSSLPYWQIALGISSALSLILLAYIALQSRPQPVRSLRPIVPANTETTQALPTLAELSMMSSEELAIQDLALLNLRAAEGLPGSENLNVTEVLATLDRWAQKVKLDTDRNLYQFLQKPDEFHHSEAYYRMLILVTVLQQDFGVHYNLERINDIDFTRCQDLFLHGMVGSSNGGTCVSMPVLYTAVARRLGYPVYLVNAKEHLFCRWDAAGQRINVEGTNQGMNSFDDLHYRNWPHPTSTQEVESGRYLKSLTNAESFSAFLAARAHCFEDSGNRSDAAVCYSLAVKHSANHPMYRSFLSQLVRPKTIEDYPELLAQQERLRQEQERRSAAHRNASGPNNPFGFANPNHTAPPQPSPFSPIPQPNQATSF
jgi:hypothetical protein